MSGRYGPGEAERQRELSAAARHRAAEHAKTKSQQEFAAEQQAVSDELDALHEKLHPEKY